MAVSVVCITERSLVNAVKRQGDAAYRYAREDMDRRKERHAERQEERRRLRQERVRGVDLAATDFSAQENEGNEHFYEEPVPDGGFAEQAGRQQQEADWNGREAERIRQEKVPAGWNRSGQPVGYEAAGQEESSLTKEAGKGRNIRAADAKTGESRESQQGFLSAGERAEGKASTQPDPEPTVDPADVFSGEIMMAGNYEGEDFAPFEADKVLSPAESAQLLVAEGISRLSDYEGSFGRPVEPPAFHKPASEPAYHGLAAVLDEPVKGTKEPGGMTWKQMSYVQSLARELGWVTEAGQVDDKRLNGFISKRFGVDHYRWLSRSMASKVIEGLKNMKKGQEETK